MMYDFSDYDIDCEISGYAEYNKDCNDYAVKVQFLEPVTLVFFTKEDLLHLLKMLEEGEDR